MLQLHGFPMSNYFNVVKAVLLEKGIEFEQVAARPSQESDYLARSPMGKVPCIRTEHGFLSETQVICEYLEEICPEPALLPRSPFERAKQRELLRELELYIELPARTCYAQAFFGGEVSEEVRATARANLTRGVRAVRQLARFARSSPVPSSRWRTCSACTRCRSRDARRRRCGAGISWPTSPAPRSGSRA